MSLEPSDLLGDAALDAGVGALAERNAHHFEAMDDAQRHEAVATWRDLARAVLTAAAAAVGQPAEGSPEAQEGPGRAIIVLEDAGPDEVAVHASFYPRLEERGNGEVLATPAQAAALELLEGMAPEEA